MGGHGRVGFSVSLIVAVVVALGGTTMASARSGSPAPGRAKAAGKPVTVPRPIASTARARSGAVNQHDHDVHHDHRTMDTRVTPAMAAAASGRTMSASGEMTAAAAPFKAIERVAVIQLSFPNRAFPFTTAQVQGAMATLSSFVQEASYGKRSVTSTVVGPFMSSYQACAGGDLVREGLALADPDLDYTQFDSFYVIYNDGCNGASGSVFQLDRWDTQEGNLAMGWAQANINTDLTYVWRAYSHEFGHNMGLGHADGLDCGFDPIRSVTLSDVPDTYSAGGCKWREYYDRYDTMGLGGEGPVYNAPHKQMLGFFDPALGVERMQDVTTGTFTIGLLETRGAETKALRIARGINGPDGAPEHLWIEYRQAVGFDAPLDPTKVDGVFIHIDNMIPGRSVDTLMVDATPTNDSVNDLDTALRLDRWLFDPVSGYSITLISRTSTSATVRIVGPIAPVRCHGPLTNDNSPVAAVAGQVVHLRAEDATGAYVWSQGGTPATGNQQNFDTTFNTVGTYQVRVVSGGTTAFCTVNVAPASGTGAFAIKWGSAGSANTQFQFPQGVAVDSAGFVYVADTSNHRIVKYTSTGAYQSQFGSLGTGTKQLNLPRGVAINPVNGNIFVVDTGNHRIQRFSSSGSPLGRWGGLGTTNRRFNTPNGIAVDASGYVYVTDTGNNRVQKFTSTGGYVTQWGGLGTATNKFNTPRGIAVKGTNVWVTDYENDRVLQFTTGGTYVSTVGVGTLNGPRAVATDPSTSRIYVVDELNSRIQVYHSTTNAFITQWGSAGGGQSQFNQPMGVAAGTTGVFVADTFNHRIQKFQR